jgi:transmembrane sensor
MSPIENLARDVSMALKPGPGAERRARQRARLLDVAWQRQRYTRLALRVAPIALALVVVCLLALRVPLRGSTLEMAGEPALESGRWLRVPDDRAMKLAFADGTSINFEPKSASRLGMRSPSEARVILEAGSLKAAVRPAAVSGRTWAFDAGPYEVLVIGTELDIAWSAERNRLTVQVEHGRVRVRGGQLRDDGLLLTSGDRLNAEGARIELWRSGQLVASDAGDLRRTPATAASSDSLARANGPTHPVQPSGGAGVSPPGAASQPKGSGSAAAEVAPSWETLARSGNYSDAFSSAEQEGFDVLVERLPVAQLELLADTARLSRKPSAARAEQVLTALRRRFPATDSAQRAAFRLGLLALGAKHYGSASQWFESYLKAAPSGTFAPDASGRLIEARLKSGDTPGARAAARTYLQRFPAGPYAQVARGALRGDTLAP